MFYCNPTFSISSLQCLNVANNKHRPSIKYFLLENVEYYWIKKGRIWWETVFYKMPDESTTSPSTIQNCTSTLRKGRR